MKIGIDISHKSINVAILTSGSKEFVEQSIFETKRDPDRVIMEKIMRIIRRSIKTRIDGIGLSLSSKLDKQRGIIYDLPMIPYWEGYKLKNILEDEFNTRVCVNNDVNCFMLGEKEYGVCKDMKEVLSIILGPNIGVSVLMDDRLTFGYKDMSENARCLSLPCYNCIDIYKGRFFKIAQQISLLNQQLEEESGTFIDQKVWDKLGILVGQLISFFLINHNPEIIVLGGPLARSYARFANFMYNYLEQNVYSRALLNIIIIASVDDHSKALGASSLIDSTLI